jgi:ribonuclease P protein component
VVQEEHREAHVPAQQPSTCQEARLPASHVDPRRAGGAAITSAQGPPQAVGLIWRISDRRTFLELRRSGRRVRSGVLSVTFLPAPVGAADAPSDPPRVAFAITRRFGSAVDRNLIRRRLRAAFSEIHGRTPSPIAPGAYLLTVRPEALTRTFAQLTQDLEQAFDRLASMTGASSRVVR